MHKQTQNEPFHGGNTSQEHFPLPNSFAFCLLSFIVPSSQAPALEISAASPTVANFTCLGYFKFSFHQQLPLNSLLMAECSHHYPTGTPKSGISILPHPPFLLAPPGPIPICWGWGCSSETLLSYFSESVRDYSREKRFYCNSHEEKSNLSLFLSTALPAVGKYQSNISIYCCQFSLPGLNSPIFP